MGGATFCLKEAIKYYNSIEKEKTINQEFEFKIADLASKLLACKLVLREALDALDRKDKQAFQYSAKTKSFVPIITFEVSIVFV